MAIVDVNGNPIRTGELKEPQTARLSALHLQFAEHPAHNITPRRLVSVLSEAEQGDMTAQCDLWEDMEDRDGHLLAEIGKRKRALLTLPWSIEPPRNATATEKKAAAYVTELIQDMPDFEDVLLDMGDAIGKAFSCQEIEWRLDGREWLPAEIIHRPQRWFMLDREQRRQLRLRDNSPNGQALRPFGWIVHTHKAKSGYLDRAALYRTLTWPFVFKWYGVRDLAEFLEIYGLPVRIGTFPGGANDAEKSTLLRALAGIGHNAAGIIPEGMMIEFKEAAKGTHDPFVAMWDFCERTQSKAILGGTLTSQADGKTSTNALGNVHNEVRHDLLVSDAIQFGGTLTRDLVYPLLVLNGYPVDSLRRCPRLVFDTSEPEDLQLLADALPKLAAAGARIPVSYVQAKLKIPEPKDGEEVLRGPAAEPAPGGEPDEEEDPEAPPADKPKQPKPATAANRRGAGDEPDAADALLPGLEAAAQPAVDAWLARVEQLLADNPQVSPTEIQERLLALYGDLPTEQLVEVMAQGYAIAALAGMSDAADGR